MRPLEVLMVEDNLGDVHLTKDALREGRLPSVLHSVSDGLEAMAFLRRLGQYADAPRPDLVLLDLKLPKKDGLEVLREMKNDGDLLAIPVVVLTTSEGEDDILRAYELHANCYVTKPLGLSQFAEAVQAIEHFWFTVAKLPRPS